MADSCQPLPRRKRGRPPKSLSTTAAHPNKRVAGPYGAQQDDRSQPLLLPRPPMHAAPYDALPSVSHPYVMNAGPSAAKDRQSPTALPTQTQQKQTCESRARPRPLQSSPSSPRTGESCEEETRQGFEEEAVPTAMRVLMLAMYDQMRELRRDNRQLRDRVEQLASLNESALRRIEHLENRHQSNRRQAWEMLEECVASIEDPTSAKMSCLRRKLDDLMALLLSHESQYPFALCMDRHSISIHDAFPALKEYDLRWLLVNDIRQPFVILKVNEPQTLEEIEPPTIAYASPPLCTLMNYSPNEVVGASVTEFGSLDYESVESMVRHSLARIPSRIGSPFPLNCYCRTAENRFVRVSSLYQFLYGPDRLARWGILLIQSVHEAAVPPVPSHRPKNILRQPFVWHQLLARLPESLLFGCQGDPDLQRPPLPTLSLGWESGQTPERQAGSDEQRKSESSRPLGEGAVDPAAEIDSLIEVLCDSESPPLLTPSPLYLP